MKRFLKYGFLALVGVLSLACDKLDLPAAAGTIEGPDKLFEGHSITLGIGAIEGATTYKWTKDGGNIQHSASRTLIVTQAGTYCVVGVNAAGHGQASAAKTIVLSDEQLLIDRMAGRWNVSEYGVNPQTNTPFLNDHVVTITKIDDQTVEIANFTWANYPDETGEFGDTVRATIDSDAGTMTFFPDSQFIPSWAEDYATFLSPAIEKNLGDNLGLPFPPQTFTEDENGKLQMTMKTGNLIYELTIGTETKKLPVTYLITTMQLGVYTGSLAYYVGTTWTKE